MDVLIAEDDFRVANIHEQFLNKIGKINIVGKTSSCKETLQFIRKQQPKLVLLDNYMPDGLGIDLIDDIRDISENVDIILVSAENEIHYFEKALRKGVKGIIIKPATLEHFIGTIENYMENRKLLENRDCIDQTVIDKIFGVKIVSNNFESIKGIDPLSLRKVEKILNDGKGGFTAEEMGAAMKASRTTARRYLEYLVSVEKCYAELDYGIVGRPERHYFLKT
ncbi:response regulator [Planococcus sp. X10-3]|uniref:response regulator n=1 Tax=Planococcus sp. X10-3 TaxID=3061240 RepID=UPI003BAF3E90